MKHFFMGLMVMPVVGFAALAQDGRPPLQSYQTASGSESSLSTSPTSAQADTHRQTNNPPVNLLDHQSASTLQVQIDQLNRNNMLFQQRADQRLVEMDTRIKDLQQHLQILEQAMTLFNRQLVEMKNKATTVAPAHIKTQTMVSQPKDGDKWSKLTTQLAQLQDTLGIEGDLIVVGGLLVILLLLLAVLWRRKRQLASFPSLSSHSEVNAVPVEEDDTKEEYDWMGSEESIPAKINLARTYIAMEDVESARKVLDEVCEHGDENQQKEANMLLAELSTGCG